MVPNTYLDTSNPPPIPSLVSSFFGTGLPTVYVIIVIVVVVVVVTLMMGIAYFRIHKKSTLTGAGD